MDNSESNRALYFVELIVCCYAEIPSSRIQYILHLVDVPLTKEDLALAKKDVPLAMEGLALGDEDFFPLQDSYSPVIPSSSSSGTTEVPPNPRTGLDGSHGARISTPPCEADDEEDNYPDGVQLQIEARTTADWKTIREYQKTTGKHFINLNAGFTKRIFITQRDVKPVKQNPYSPDLNLFDRFLFQKLKYLLRNDEVSEDELFDQLKRLWEHCYDVIATGGDCIF
ncbi:Uncharacterized protein FKW44_006621 [Caligus rogercresseyi]|uniref:Uncharacterized protein n=1 Tax=Caligus rogercresseyi TaxID=217165 RepID=A0A7T8QSZ1_CALRO|nr:Uncharacterized protein FKW44_006621 [Caligus rogercresseyi]